MIEEYSNQGVEFLKEVCLRATFLEDLTGLTELRKATVLTDVSTYIIFFFNIIGL